MGWVGCAIFQVAQKAIMRFHLVDLKTVVKCWKYFFLVFLYSINIPCSVAGLDLRSNVLLRAVVFSQVFDGFFRVVVLVLVRPYLPPLFLGNFGGQIFREIAVCNHALRFQVVLLW